MYINFIKIISQRGGVIIKMFLVKKVGQSAYSVIKGVCDTLSWAKELGKSNIHVFVNAFGIK